MLRSLLGTGGTLQHHSYLAATRCRRNLHRNLPSQIQIGIPTSRRAAGFLHVQPTSKIPRNTAISGISRFHSTPRRQGAPIVPLLLGALKASTALELARTIARVTLTIVPILVWKNVKTRKRMEWAAIHGKPVSEEKKEQLLHHNRKRTVLFHALIFLPCTLFWATIIASMERTPLTGRWRLILLSPEEEDEIAAQLAGPGWYKAVGDILSAEGPPRVIPCNDWRYQWVQDTLRQLESVIPILQQEQFLEPEWLKRDPQDSPLPPPAEYPLHPRPRASEYLRAWCEIQCARKVQPAPHAIPGPPYSLVVVDKPEASNAFSYGFGPDGGGGVVVYSGFLDDVLSTAPCTPSPPVPAEISWFSSLFGPPRRPPSHPVPTPEQTSQLAILLAHELAHLILSHHLETLSSATIIVPGVLSIVSDTIRALLFPITMIFGPFVNDAVAQLGKVGSMEISKIGEYCTSTKQEMEADVVSARLLAHAGFDARQAIQFWETRHGEKKTECSASRGPAEEHPIARGLMGSTHPVDAVRVNKLRDELLRWELERRVTLQQIANQPHPAIAPRML